MIGARSFAWILAAAGIAGGCSQEPPIELTVAERAAIFALSPLPPAPKDSTNAVDGDPRAIELGRRLFYDAALSGDGRFSCASCHDEAKGWTDGKPVASAAGQGRRNTPSLWNVAQNRWFFLDGRADTLWSQALKPIEDPLEMNGTRLGVAHYVLGDNDLRARYAELFGPAPDLSDTSRFPRAGGPGVSDEEQLLAWWRMSAEDQIAVNRVYANVGKAIAALEATIRGGEAPFDRFVRELRAGAPTSAAISPAAQRGLKVFIGKGNCVLCHSGPNFTNKEFHDIRIPPRADAVADFGRNEGLASLANDEFIAAGPYSDDPQGRRAQLLYFLDSRPGSIGHFKTPSLRNVATTPPYMHAGQIATLRDVVRHYSTLESAAPPADPAHAETLIRKLDLTETEIDDLVAFLESLTSESLPRSNASAAAATY